MVQMIQKEDPDSPTTIATTFATPAKEWTGHEEADESIVPKDLTEAFNAVEHEPEPEPDHEYEPESGDDIEKDIAAELQKVLDDVSIDTRSDEADAIAKVPSVDNSRSSAESLNSEVSDNLNVVEDDVEKELAAEVQKALDDASVNTGADDTVNPSSADVEIESVRSEGDETKKLDLELNAAIQRALNHPDAKDDSTIGDDRSVVSASLSVSSTKSAVQLRLEARKKNKEPTMDAFTAKIEAANRRRKDFLQNVTGKVEKHLEKISSGKNTAEEKKDAEVEALKKKHDQKLTIAAQRKEYFLQSISGNASSELKKVSSARSVVEEKKGAEVAAIQKKHGEKLARAGERKEYFQHTKTSQLKTKNEKISNTKSIIEAIQDAEVLALKKKHDEKLTSATERKEYFLKGISGKSEAQLGKIASARTATEEQQDAEVQAIKKKHEEKLANATERKEYFLKGIAGKSERQLEKIATARTAAEQQQEAEVQAIKKKHEEKLANATERKEYFLKGIAGKSEAQFEKIATAKTVAKEQQEAEVQALSKKHAEKLARANERKEHFIKSIAGKSEKQLEKVSTAKTAAEEKKEADVIALKKKHDEKLATAVKRKEELLQSNSGKVEAKLEKVSNAKSTAEEQRLAEVKKKHDEKLSNATERKEQLLQAISGNAGAKFEKVHSARSLVEEKKEAEVQSIKKKQDEKLSTATERKQYFLQSKTSSFRHKMEKFVSSKKLETTDESDTASLKDELDRKLHLAASRRQAALQERKNKVSTYLASTFDRGQEALKRKRLRPEESAQMEELDELEDAGLMWLPDDVSLADSMNSTASSKSAVQIRLESYKRSTPTREKMDAKLRAAHERRQRTIAMTQEKAGFKAKMEKVSETMRTAELAVKDLSDQFSRKMKSATKRREEYMEDYIGGRSLQEKKKMQIAREKNAKKAEKVSAMQQKLESKLLSALERKEKILNAKATKAAGNVSISSKRGQAALDQKEATVEQLRQKSLSKLASAKRRRQGLRKLEKEKKEVIMLRREMARSVDQETRMVSVQDMLKSNFEDKLQAAEERRTRIAEEERKKIEVRNKRRRAALEMARQRKAEAQEIAAWTAVAASKDETESLAESLPPVLEEKEELNEDTKEEPQPDLVLGGGMQDEEGSLDERRLMARQQLVDEIRLANEAKYNELDRIRKEMKSVKRFDNLSRECSNMSFGTIESTEMLSFDEGEVSISGLSTVREEESEADRKKAKAALALAELDIKLSEIQLLQAMLLAEEASLSGAEEFKTCEKSVHELDQVQVVPEQPKKSTRRRFQLAPKNLLTETMRRAREATTKAGRTIEDIRRSVNSHEKNRKAKMAPSLVKGS